MKAAFGLLLVQSVGSTTGCTGAKKEEHDSSDPAPSSQLAQVAEDSWFLDITDQSGIDFVHVNGAKGQKYLPEIMGAGGAVLDFDRDGFMDIFLVQSGHIAGQNQAPSQLPDRLFRNRGNGTFEDLTQEAGIGPGNYGMGAVAGDFDGDGDGDSRLDIIVTNLNNEANALYLGDEGQFRYQTRAAGLYAGSFRPVGFGVDLVDLDNDQDLDILVTNGHVMDNIDRIDEGQTFPQPTQIRLNDGSGNFHELTAAEVGDPSTPRVGRLA